MRVAYELTFDNQNEFYVRATRKWGKVVLVGEDGTMELYLSPDLIQNQKTVYGSWNTSIRKMEELVERLVCWDIHPEDLVTHRFPLENPDKAYAQLNPCLKTINEYFIE